MSPSGRAISITSPAPKLWIDETVPITAALAILRFKPDQVGVVKFLFCGMGQLFAGDKQLRALERLSGGAVLNACERDHRLARLAGAYGCDLETAAMPVIERAIARETAGLGGEELDLHRALQTLRADHGGEKNRPRQLRSRRFFRLGRGAGGGALLRLLPGLGLLRIVVHAGLSHAGLHQPFVHAVGRHRALGDPGFGGVEIELDAVGVIGRQKRIVEPDLLDEAAIARGCANPKSRYCNAGVSWCRRAPDECEEPFFFSSA